MEDLPVESGNKNSRFEKLKNLFKNKFVKALGAGIFTGTIIYFENSAYEGWKPLKAGGTQFLWTASVAYPTLNVYDRVRESMSLVSEKVDSVISIVTVSSMSASVTLAVHTLAQTPEVLHAGVTTLATALIGLGVHQVTGGSH
jgi:hypothetical protein